MLETEDSLLLEIGPMALESLRELGFLEKDQGLDNDGLVEMYSDIYTNSEIYFNLSSENLSSAPSDYKTRYLKELKKHILFFLEVAETQAAFHVFRKMDLPTNSVSKQDRHIKFIEILREKKDMFSFSLKRSETIERLHLLCLINEADYSE